MGRTPLYDACVYGIFDIIGPLLDAGALIDDKCDLISERTALMETCIRISQTENHQKILKYLLQNGADKTLKDSEGNTAFDLAKLANIKNNPNLQSVMQLLAV